MLVLSLLHNNNPDLNARCSTRVNKIGLMGLYPQEKAASTGTLTRIFANAMELSMASKKNFHTYSFFYQHLFLFLSAFISMMLFSMHTITFIVWFLESNMRVRFRSILGIHITLSLITLTICKSHFQTFY